MCGALLGLKLLSTAVLAGLGYADADEVKDGGGIYSYSCLTSSSGKK